MVNFDPPLNRYEKRWRERADENSLYIKLRSELLNIGGDNVVPSYEPDLRKMVERGSIIKPIEIIHSEMRSSKCHQNSAWLYRNDESITSIGTGWALSDDGLWRQHSWAHRGDEIVETTVKREKYFGLILEGEDAEEFCSKNIP